MLSGLISLHAPISRLVTFTHLGEGSGNSPVDDLLTVEIVACRRQFSGPEADTPLVDLSFAFHMDCMRVNGHRSRPIIPNQGRVRDPLKEQRQTALTPQVASEHEVQNEEAVVVVLERIAHVHDERMVDLVRLNRITGNQRDREPKQSVQ